MPLGQARGLGRTRQKSSFGVLVPPTVTGPSMTGGDGGSATVVSPGSVGTTTGGSAGSGGGWPGPGATPPAVGIVPTSVMTGAVPPTGKAHAATILPSGPPRAWAKASTRDAGIHSPR